MKFEEEIKTIKKACKDLIEFKYEGRTIQDIEYFISLCETRIWRAKISMIRKEQESRY